MGREYAKSLVIGALLGVALALVFAAGFFMRDIVDMPSAFASSTGQDDTGTSGYPLVDEVQNLLDRHYLHEQPEYTERQYAAIRGIVGLLDRNTFFIDPPVAQSESQVLAGTYGGIGVSIQRDASGSFVLYPFPDGPAAERGIEGGDILVAVNGTAIDLNMQQDAVDQMMRGEVKDDNGVELTVLRDGEELVRFVPFEVINVPSVMWRVLSQDERIGYIQVMRFTSRTPDELNEAAEALTAENIAALVLDLRGNSGGLLHESVEVASAFLDGGVVLYEQTKADERTFSADEGGTLLEVPLAVLVDAGTASASELVAGAIQDRERGMLIGQTTYGKGTIQQIFALSDGSSVHVTSAEWFTPGRNALDGVGLQPDIPMIPDEAGRDIEIDEAIRYLQTVIAETVTE